MKIQIGVDGAMKLCRGCNKCNIGVLEIMHNFYRDSSRADGFRVYCKKCMRQGRGRYTRELDMPFNPAGVLD